MPASSKPLAEPDSAQQPADYNPFDEVEVLPGLGAAVLWVVAALVLAHLLLFPAHML